MCFAKPGELNFIDCTDYCEECSLDKKALMCKKYNEKVLKLGNPVQYLRCTTCGVLKMQYDWFAGIGKFLDIEGDSSLDTFWNSTDEDPEGYIWNATDDDPAPASFDRPEN